MSKEKDIHWHDNQVQKLKKKKRLLCKPVSSFEYDSVYRNNKEIKKIKADIIRERRAIKRAEKQTVKKHIEEEILKNEKSKGE